MSNTPPPPSSPPPPSPAPAPQPAPSANSGLLGRVFDLSFSEFVTPSIIKILFILGVVMAGIFSLFLLVGFIAQGGVSILVGLVIAPLMFIVYTLFVRVMCELYILLFRIEENTRKP